MPLCTVLYCQSTTPTAHPPFFPAAKRDAQCATLASPPALLAARQRSEEESTGRLPSLSPVAPRSRGRSGGEGQGGLRRTSKAHRSTHTQASSSNGTTLTSISLTPRLRLRQTLFFCNRSRPCHPKHEVADRTRPVGDGGSRICTVGLGPRRANAFCGESLRGIFCSSREERKNFSGDV